jgi:2-aminoethylphosphonate-pyruvate transaminase
MLKDWCTWDDDYNVNVVQSIRSKLVKLATKDSHLYTSILMQGSGTFSVEATLGSVIPKNGKLLVLSNGAYGQRMVKIAKILGIDHIVYDSTELKVPDCMEVHRILTKDVSVTHIAMVHCETTTGMLNPVEEIASVAKEFGKTFIVDAMSSFGGIPMDVASLNIDYLISSANKCIQGVPGFGFVIARKDKFSTCKNLARSHSLDLYDQWETMEQGNGKWRFTSPTHVVRAFDQALKELEEEGGIEQRFVRYTMNQKYLASGMKKLGFKTVLPNELQSPIITSFHSPDSAKYEFDEFYKKLKEKGFAIYPGKVSTMETFRIGNIGEVYYEDIARLLRTIKSIIFW